jgi:hypothetical protein
MRSGGSGGVPQLHKLEIDVDRLGRFACRRQAGFYVGGSSVQIRAVIHASSRWPSLTRLGTWRRRRRHDAAQSEHDQQELGRRADCCVEQLYRHEGALMTAGTVE